MCLLGNCTLWWTGSEMRCMYNGNKVKSLSLSDSLRPYGLQLARLLHRWDFPGKNTGKEYWSVLPFPYPGDLPDPGIELGSPTLQADSLPTEPPGKPSILVSSLNQKNVILDFIHEAHISLQVELGNLINSSERFSGLLCSQDTT